MHTLALQCDIYIQLIYDFKDGDGSLGLISLNPDLIPTEDEMKFRSIGVQIPSMK